MKNETCFTNLQDAKETQDGDSKTSCDVSSLELSFVNENQKTNIDADQLLSSENIRISVEGERRENVCGEIGKIRHGLKNRKILIILLVVVVVVVAVSVSVAVVTTAKNESSMSPSK